MTNVYEKALKYMKEEMNNYTGWFKIEYEGYDATLILPWTRIDLT